MYETEQVKEIFSGLQIDKTVFWLIILIMFFFP